MNNASPPFVNVPLSSFLGLYTEASPVDLPEGASPRNWDVDFIIGSVLMRPGIGNAISFGGRSTGPNGPTSGTDGSNGGVPWTNPNAILHPDSVYSSLTIPSTFSPSPYAGTAINVFYNGHSSAFPFPLLP